MVFMDAATIQKITNLESLRAFLSSHPELGARDAMLTHYAEMGMQLSFRSSRDAPIHAHGTNLGSVDCAWNSPHNVPVVALELELGEREEMLGAVWKLAELAPELAVIIVNSADVLEQTKSLLLRSKLTRALTQTFLIFEIETGRSELINKRAPSREGLRRKVIHGTRHEHKEQD
ncbi:MAG: hypothetical protein AB1468_01295 [Candidatus Micrarchaeota archaeon]